MNIKSFFSPTTRRGRAIRTGLQVLVGVITFVAGILTIPGVQQLLIDAGWIAQAASLATWVAIIAYIQNALEAFIRYLSE